MLFLAANIFLGTLREGLRNYVLKKYFQGRLRNRVFSKLTFSLLPPILSDSQTIKSFANLAYIEMKSWNIIPDPDSMK